MTTFKPTDTKREEFRKYLERTGVMDSLTKILVSLYEESDKPPDALEYLRKKLNESVGQKGETVEELKEKLEKCAQRIQQLEMENCQLKGVPYVPGENTEKA